MVERKPVPGQGLRSASVQVYHWGSSDVPPFGAPMPPASGIRQASQNSLDNSLPQPLPRGTASSVPGPAAPSLPSSLPSVSSSAGAAVPVEQHLAGPGCTLVGSQGVVPCGSCRLEHYSEKPPRIDFKPGGCLPVSAPSELPPYGYYQTQWHPYPGPVRVEVPEVEEPAREQLPPPSISPMRYTAGGR